MRCFAIRMALLVPAFSISWLALPTFANGLLQHGSPCSSSGECEHDEEVSMLSLGRSRLAGKRSEDVAKAWVQFPPGSEVTDLPGVPADVRDKFRMASGYIPVGGGKQLFYVFVESQGSPSEDPLLLWTNGGPGCSGLLGFMTEMGPLRPMANGSLEVNPFAWTEFANMVFIEQPAGVGFSQPSSDFEYTDEAAAADNWDFIKGFLQQYPQLKSHDFWLTSESYGGHYVPTLAREILRNNKGDVNFKGLIIGNPLIYLPYTNHGMYAMYNAWGLIPDPQLAEYVKHDCAWIDDEGKPMKEHMSKASIETCYGLQSHFYRLAMDMDPYALGFPVCDSDEVNAMMSFMRPKWYSRARSKSATPLEYSPCVMDHATSYLNQAGVQKALHVQGSVAWHGCSSGVRYSRKSVDTSMVPVIRDIIAHGGVRVMIMSGSEDSVCSSLGDQRWLWDTGYNNTEAWGPYFLDGQVAGFTTEFTAENGAGFRYTTVLGAGHMIPSTQPKRGSHIVKHFLSGEW
eukprot:TRINITY_DN71772_c0_g1_i1.p1 TRINITY_DN71772_c0_g1~~TRINITY_DN71772_c0_g1_i1.p1  ORF type:complete len:513 (-),score=63.18 TRINITY_DN71772_c0_g1_i1:255-1793(-)